MFFQDGYIPATNGLLDCIWTLHLNLRGPLGAQERSTFTRGLLAGRYTLSSSKRKAKAFVSPRRNLLIYGQGSGFRPSNKTNCTM